jgi:hypothetical protein
MVIAKILKLPTEYILGLAALESQYGKGRIAKEYNNFFSMHAPAPFQSGAIAPLGNAKIKVAIYPSFMECARSFSTRFGSTLVGLGSPDAFAKELVRLRFNTGNPATGGTAGYPDKVVAIIKVVKLRMECIKS